MKIKKTLLYCCLSSLLFSGCTTKKDGSELQQYSMTSTTLGFDTVITFTAYTKDESTFKNYESILMKDFKYYDQLFDKYHSYDTINNIKTINDQAGQKPVKVENDIFELLSLAKEFDSISNHKFSVTMGSVLNIWHDTRTQAEKNDKEITLPSMDVLNEANSHTGWNFVELNEKAKTVFIKNKDTQLDVGAIAKGYAVEKIAKKLEKAGLEHAIINAGGNVRLIGTKPNNKPWSVGLQIPDQKQLSTESLISLLIKDSTSFVTSGDYQRYFEYNGELMHHIIDPSTLMPARYCRSVTVITKDSGIADMLSTTLFTMSYQDGVNFLKQLKKDKNIEAEAIWVYDDTILPDSDVKTLYKSSDYYLLFTDGVKQMIKEK